MRYQDVIQENIEEGYGIVITDNNDDILFEGEEINGQILFGRMFRHGRTWLGYAYDQSSCKGTKASVADWCLGKAVDG